ncbi:pyridine nucleotide transhydrogenase [Pantoea eucrina]|uniref:Pyridine nucleotide transhydrogenase n=1 Tax=Pantoea eucrina TaxID=472693 RepID=A0ABU5LDF7_9GAMM|nr:pyridine nucleotide transhydrogenase [Pantoea eucrina]MDZ7277983.1 pyridine nucleotide transhydrogenase [Pantoea eucrina]
MDALIGYSGFVGCTLLKQRKFDALYRSTNVDDVIGKTFDTVVCAAAPAQKWLANKNPSDDLQQINSLIAKLKTISCKKFILISTVDVFKTPVDVDENTPIETEGLHAYGLHRYYLEQFVSQHFPDALIVRLPGLVGPGLKKNIIYDFLNNNNLEQIESRGVFQFYPMINLWYDIEIALQNGLKLLHLTAAPISVADVARFGFGFEFENHVQPKPGHYDMKSCHSHLFTSNNDYQYSHRESLMSIRAYAQSEATKESA